MRSARAAAAGPLRPASEARGGSVPAPSLPPEFASRPPGRRGARAPLACPRPRLSAARSPASGAPAESGRGPGGELFARVDVRGLARRAAGRPAGRAPHPAGPRTAPAGPPAPSEHRPPPAGPGQVLWARAPERVKLRRRRLAGDSRRGHCWTRFSGKQVLWVSAPSPQSQRDTPAPGSECLKPPSE